MPPWIAIRRAKKRQLAIRAKSESNSFGAKGGKQEISSYLNRNRTRVMQYIKDPIMRTAHLRTELISDEFVNPEESFVGIAKDQRQYNEFSSQVILGTDGVSIRMENMLQSSSRKTYSGCWVQFLLILRHFHVGYPLEPVMLLTWAHLVMLLGHVSISASLCIVFNRIIGIMGSANWAHTVFGPEASWTQARDRISRAHRSKSSLIVPLKAQVIRSPSLYGINVTAHREILFFWINSALRMSGLLSLAKSDFQPDKSSQWTQITVHHVRHSTDFEAPETRWLPSHLAEHIIARLPINMNYAQYVMWNLNRWYLRSQNLTDESGVPRFSGHSARRTWSCTVRMFLHRRGLDTHALPADVLARINFLAGWAKANKSEWKKYSKDFLCLKDVRLFVAYPILKWIETGVGGPPMK